LRWTAPRTERSCASARRIDLWWPHRSAGLTNLAAHRGRKPCEVLIAALFMLGPAVPHPYKLVTGYYPAHTIVEVWQRASGALARTARNCSAQGGREPDLAAQWKLLAFATSTNNAKSFGNSTLIAPAFHEQPKRSRGAVPWPTVHRARQRPPVGLHALLCGWWCRQTASAPPSAATRPAGGDRALSPTSHLCGPRNGR
jgi:hypothetical protein